MKAKTTIQALMLLFILLPAWAVAAGLGELRLSLVEGDVQIKTVDTGEWAPAAINLPLKDGDQLWVPDQGRAEVEARRGSIVRLDERSLLEILRVDNDALQFYLSMGLGYVNAKGERGSTLQLDTPVSSIRVYERAKFSAEVADDGLTDIAVFLGVVSAENRRGITRVEAGNMLTLGDDLADLSPLGLADAWEEWNKDQDRIIEERRESARYLPDELAGYSRDFDDNGEWVEDPSYGFIWRPLLEISIGWSPYRHGRWSHIPRHGWCWVPPERHDVYWGPGYVGWVRTSTHVSWVPLAPRETYYGHGNFGRHSINIINVDVKKVVVQKNVYKNVYIDNSVTTVHNDTFIRGKKVDVHVKENPFLKEKISVGRPRMEPERATKIAVIKEVPKDKAPPARAREIDVNKLKEHRRLVKKEGQSVFVPDKAPEAMPVEVRKEPKTRTPRKPRRADGESEKGKAPTPEGEIKSAPTGGEGGPAGGPAATPTEGKRRPKGQRTPSAAEGGAGEGPEGQRGERQSVAPAPQAETPPAPGEKLAPADPSSPAPESKRRPRRTPPAGVKQGQPGQERGVSQQPVDPTSPPPEPGRKPRRKPPAGVEQGQPGQGGGESGVDQQQPVESTSPLPETRRRPRRTPPAQVEQGQPAQGGVESWGGQQPVEPSAPPPEPKRRPRRAPPAEVEGGQQPPQDGGGERLQRREQPPPQQWQEAQPPSQEVVAPPVEGRMEREPRPRRQVGQPGADGGARKRVRQEVVPPPQGEVSQPPPVVPPPGEVIQPPPGAPPPGEVTSPPPAEGKKKVRKKKTEQQEGAETEAQP